jgi:hypothetical protein
MDCQPKVLFLDDRSKRIHAAIKKYNSCELTIVTSANECLQFISNNEYDLISLDHDLNGQEFTSLDEPNSGMAVVKYICRSPWPHEKKRPKFTIHSSNVFAATAMEEMLKEHTFYVKRERFNYDDIN